MTTYDLVIVGAGPAGANLARMVGDHYRVLWLDARKPSLAHKNTPISHKCCGGLLAPDAQQMLARLGLGIPKDILVGPQLFSVKVMDLTSRLEGSFQRFYYNIDRDRFDQWLIDLVPSSVERRFGALFKSCRPTPDGMEITYTDHDSPGHPKTALCRLLVGADGGNSAVRRQFDPARPEYIAIQEWYPVKDAMPYFTAIFDAQQTDFYGWTIPKDDYLLFGAALKVGDAPRERFEALKDALIKKGLPLGSPVHTEGAFIRRPWTLQPVLAERPWGVALIGEAAGAISPSSAEGISYALHSATLLAESLLADGVDRALRRYRTKCRAIRLNLALKQLKRPLMYQPELRRLGLSLGLGQLNELDGSKGLLGAHRQKPFITR